LPIFESWNIVVSWEGPECKWELLAKREFLLVASYVTNLSFFFRGCCLVFERNSPSSWPMKKDSNFKFDFSQLYGEGMG